MRKFLLSFLLLALITVPVSAAETRTAPVGDLGKVLVIYYSYTGVTEKVALKIAVSTDADVYQIEPAQAYDAENPRAEVKIQREQNQMPALKAPVPDISAYDLIIVGNPIWSGDVPPPVVSLLNQLAFNGKPLAYFCTSGPRPREYMEKFKEYVSDVALLDGINFGELPSDEAALASVVDAWLVKLAAELQDNVQNTTGEGL